MLIMASSCTMWNRMCRVVGCKSMNLDHNAVTQAETIKDSIKSGSTFANLPTTCRHQRQTHRSTPRTKLFDQAAVATVTTHHRTPIPRPSGCDTLNIVGGTPNAPGSG